MYAVSREDVAVLQHIIIVRSNIFLDSVAYTSSNVHPTYDFVPCTSCMLNNIHGDGNMEMNECHIWSALLRSRFSLYEIK